MLKKTFFAMLAALLLLNGLACKKNEGANQGKVGVAAILNLTGPAARFDAVKQQTLTIAQERVKALYPNAQIQLDLLDAGGGPEATTVAVRQALQKGASCFLSGTSPTALAIAAQVRDHNPAVAQMANAANPDFGPPRPGEYRLWPDWKQEAEIIAGILREANLTKILLIHSADPYSEALTKALNEQAQASSALALNDLQYDPASTPDFRPALLRAKQDQVQALVIFGLPPGIRALMAQMAEVNWDQTLIGGVNINLAVADFDATGLKGPLWLVQTEAMQDSLPQDSEAQLFRSAYLAKYNEKPPFHALYLADALYFLAAGSAGNAEAPAPAIVEHLGRVRNFESASGRIEVDENGVLRFVMRARKAR